MVRLSEIKAVNETQDGRPLLKYIEFQQPYPFVAWERLPDVEVMSTSDALNLLLLKILTSDDHEADIGYVIQQLERAKPPIVDALVPWLEISIGMCQALRERC